jgi:hypothetical protein
LKDEFKIRQFKSNNVGVKHKNKKKDINSDGSIERCSQ